MKEMKSTQGIEITGLNIKEMDESTKVALKIFDSWNVPEGVTMRQLFAIAFMKGREFTLEELGFLDENEDDANERAQEFLRKYY